MRDTEMIFLGTGTSQGIPMIGCECRVCRSSDPRDNRLRSAIQLRTPEMVIQVDTPPDFRTQCLRERITNIDVVIYTHSHTDHILGFDDLRRFCELGDKSMPIYASPHTMEDIRRVYQYAFEGEFRYKNYIRPEPNVIDGPFSLGETLITAVGLPHGRTVTSGLIFSRGGRKMLAYFTDCNAVPSEAEEAARDAEVLVIDALRYAPHPTHLSVEQATEVARRIRAKKTYFTHMCHDLCHAEAEAALPDDIRLAYDGLRVAI